MNSVQSVFNKTKLSRRQRRRHRNSAASAFAATGIRPGESFLSSTTRDSVYKNIKACKNIVPIVHGIVVSNLSLVLLQKEYIEQFYFEKRSGGGGPDPDAQADLRRLLNKNLTKLQRLRFG